MERCAAGIFYLCEVVGKKPRRCPSAAKHGAPVIWYFGFTVFSKIALRHLPDDTGQRVFYEIDCPGNALAGKAATPADFDSVLGSKMPVRSMQEKSIIDGLNGPAGIERLLPLAEMEAGANTGHSGSIERNNSGYSNGLFFIN